ncbi:extracellular solute-binding protein [Aeromicrobium sp. SMF47]|uniref:Extracellular solute-binding protein n=1 Tax=Aeromicrobium yanjiei TaxID=2662028 RepID=A0A5Q2MIF3_9ACTN|nr:MULTISPECIES: extracellular solute-binding protein [Aeromicrobium]MRJ78097.1 extracellular solute-binding protein [Aeromicrobium yanjiei]MRK03271.1 extracellular solute-binding protein [Aeromicrobium sp. S22]QGG40826.1 extracellular solute-binding protein [Aeromicrobium yanjiei]
MKVRPIRRLVTGVAVAALSMSMLAACGGDSGKPTLNWYINPDGQETLTAIAERCSTDEYDIEIQLLPSSATDQRTQLARRLAAEDSSTDLMSLDPVFIPEFANANWLAPFEGELADQVVDDDVLKGPAEIVQWEDQVVAAPQWSNTQVLWYRKSLAEAAGLDMSQPVTWDQIIDAAADHDGTIGVQASKYEAYVVWINSLIQGAGGNILDPSTVEDGRDAKVTIDSEAGKAAAAVIEKLAKSTAKQPDFTTSNEGTSLGAMFPEQGAGEFMTNWTFVYKNYEGLIGKPGGPKDEAQFEDLGWARYPETVEGEESRPPLGGIAIGVGAYTKHRDFAQQAAMCVTDADAQVALGVNNGFMPSRGSVYDSEELKKAFPPDLLTLFSQSIDSAGTRPKSAFYSQISSALQSRWHSPSSVGAGTPKKSADFLNQILKGEALL